MSELRTRLETLADDATGGVVLCDARGVVGRRRRRRSPLTWLVALVAAASAGLVGGGAVLNPSGDTVVTAVEEPAPGPPPAGPAVASDAAPSTIYLPGPSPGFPMTFADLVAVSRRFRTTTPEARAIELVDAIIAGPDAEEQRRGIGPARFAAADHLRSVRLVDGTLIVDFTEDIIEPANLRSDAGGTGLITTLLANAFTLPEVDAFELWGEGSCATFASWASDPGEPEPVGCVRRTRHVAEAWRAEPPLEPTAPLPFVDRGAEEVAVNGVSLPDGAHMGFVRAVIAGERQVVFFDLVQWRSGAAASGEAVPADIDHAGDEAHLVVNESDRLRELVVADEATVDLIDGDRCCDPVPASFEDLLAAVAPATDEPGSLGDLFTVTVAHGQVVAMEEVNVP